MPRAEIRSLGDGTIYYCDTTDLAMLGRWLVDTFARIGVDAKHQVQVVMWPLYRIDGTLDWGTLVTRDHYLEPASSIDQLITILQDLRQAQLEQDG